MQDLQFQLTPNTENFQVRYIITHPATGDFNCDAGKKYLKELRKRRHGELETLAALTDKGYDDWDLVADRDEEKFIPSIASYRTASFTVNKQKKEQNTIIVVTMFALGLVSLSGLKTGRSSFFGF